MSGFQAAGTFVLPRMADGTPIALLQPSQCRQSTRSKAALNE